MRIGFTIVNCPLGRLLVAATERGLCAVYLGDSDEDLSAELAQQYPAAAIVRDDAGLAPWVAALVAYLDGPRPAFALPLDL
ncbi:MAG: bifunctional transcriptional activator/DNA repair enzyme protein Ada, partial [Isosphaeraceae bacterium]|nr:bifunctional transcriptional activator/DNA repair enzyme protein Ada [Isosphaeraceae bacterium]